MEKDSPDICRFPKVSKKVRSPLDNNIIFLMEICKYQGHPYIILTCCNVVSTYLFDNIFLQYYFGQLNFPLTFIIDTMSEYFDTSTNVRFFDVPSGCFNNTPMHLLPFVLSAIGYVNPVTKRLKNVYRTNLPVPFSQRYS